MSLVRRRSDFHCDADGCRRYSATESNGPLPLHPPGTNVAEPPIPHGWYVDLTHHFHACSLQHKEHVNEQHLAATGKRLLWLTYTEAHP